ncbi:hypothetical protein X975_12267, partial [Stegodyphus mimosarum]
MQSYCHIDISVFSRVMCRAALSIKCLLIPWVECICSFSHSQNHLVLKFCTQLCLHIELDILDCLIFINSNHI